MPDQDPQALQARRMKSSRRLLHIMLVFSFIYTGMYVLGHLSLGLSGETMREAMMQTYITMLEQNDDFKAAAIMMERFLDVPQWYYLLCALLDAVSLLGMALMWRLRRNGFHCYALAKLLLMLLPLLFLDRSFVAIGDMMLAVLFIVYYFFLLKVLGAFSPQHDDTPAAPSESCS